MQPGQWARVGQYTFTAAVKHCTRAALLLPSPLPHSSRSCCSSSSSNEQQRRRRHCRAQHLPHHCHRPAAQPRHNAPWSQAAAAAAKRHHLLHSRRPTLLHTAHPHTHRCPPRTFSRPACVAASSTSPASWPTAACWTSPTSTPWTLSLTHQRTCPRRWVVCFGGPGGGGVRVAVSD